jgi:hypothetical protein
LFPIHHPFQKKKKNRKVLQKPLANISCSHKHKVKCINFSVYSIICYLYNICSTRCAPSTNNYIHLYNITSSGKYICLLHTATRANLIDIIMHWNTRDKV